MNFRRLLYGVIVTGTYLDGDRDNGRARGEERRYGKKEKKKRRRKIRPCSRIPVRIRATTDGTYTRQTCVEGYERQEKKRRERGEKREREGKSNARSVAIKIDEPRLILCKGGRLIPLLICHSAAAETGRTAGARKYNRTRGNFQFLVKIEPVRLLRNW